VLIGRSHPLGRLLSRLCLPDVHEGISLKPTLVLKDVGRSANFRRGLAGSVLKHSLATRSWEVGQISPWACGQCGGAPWHVEGFW